MKINLKNILISYISAFEEVETKLKDDFNLEFCTYWTNTFKDGQNLAAPGHVVRDIRKDVETVKNIVNKKDLSYEDFESLGNVIKAIGLQIEKNKIMDSRR